MDIKILRNFITVAREENITRAAESLHIAQPSLSKQLIDLETELGKTLLVRGKRKTSLTADGILLRKRAEEVIALYDKMEKEIKSDGTQICGQINIGGSPTDELLEIASGIRKKHPEICFNFYMNEATDVMEHLDHGSLDFAILLEPVDTMKYESISLHNTYCWGVLMPTDCPYANCQYISAEKFGTMPIILHRRAGLQRMISMWANKEPENLNITATYNVMNGNPVKYVRSGLGYFLTTEDLLPDTLDDTMCFKPLYPPLEIHFALVWKRYATLSKAAEQFLKAVASLTM